MNKKFGFLRYGLSIVWLCGLAACDREGGSHEVRQTKFPGQFSAGGGTSGEVMARNSTATSGRASSGTPGIPQGAGGNTGGAAMGGAVAGSTASGQEGVRGQTPGGTGVSGTPGIPEGAGGNPSGAAMGGTTPGAAGSQVAPPQATPPGPATHGKQ
jgi:hypothetical protein